MYNLAVAQNWNTECSVRGKPINTRQHNDNTAVTRGQAEIWPTLVDPSAVSGSTFRWHISAYCDG